MRLAQYASQPGSSSAVVVDDSVFDLSQLLEDRLSVEVPQTEVGLPGAFEVICDLPADDRDRLDQALGGLDRSVDEFVGTVEDVRLRPPITHPSKILCVGLNYEDHVREVGLQAPSRPHVFSKLPSALTGPHHDVEFPTGVAESIDYEVELAVVMARRARHLNVAEVDQHILGYTVANDVSARDWQFDDDDQLTLGKGFDTFFPLGPWIVTPDEVEQFDDLSIRCWVNADLRQETTLGTMVFDVPEIIAMISSICTLEAGDIVATGTPAGVGFGQSPPAFLRPGDTVVSEIEGIGRLTNTITSAR